MHNTVCLCDAGDNVLSGALANIKGVGTPTSATCGYLHALMPDLRSREHICAARAAGGLAR